jgi:hypothetical protein
MPRPDGDRNSHAARRAAGAVCSAVVSVHAVTGAGQHPWGAAAGFPIAPRRASGLCPAAYAGCYPAGSRVWSDELQSEQNDHRAVTTRARSRPSSRRLPVLQLSRQGQVERVAPTAGYVRAEPAVRRARLRRAGGQDRRTWVSWCVSRSPQCSTKRPMIGGFAYLRTPARSRLVRSCDLLASRPASTLSRSTTPFGGSRSRTNSPREMS